MSQDQKQSKEGGGGLMFAWKLHHLVPKSKSSSQQQQQQQPTNHVVVDFEESAIATSSANHEDESERTADDWDLISDHHAAPPTATNSSPARRSHDHIRPPTSSQSHSYSHSHGSSSSQKSHSSSCSSSYNHSQTRMTMPQRQQQNQAVWVPKAGSVRSINTLDHDDHDHDDEENADHYDPHVHPQAGSYKIPRTHSSSTLDSHEYHTSSSSNGPLGQGILGVDYVEHVILPTDTLPGICLAYKISATRLRQANHFSGNSLLLAPKKLVIPISKKACQSGFIRVQDTDQKEYKIYHFLAEYPKLGMTEAKAYLELSNWDLTEALHSAKEDVEWEQEMGDSVSTKNKAGEIRITANSKGGLQTHGAGLLRSSNSARESAASPSATTTLSAPKVAPVTPNPQKEEEEEEKTSRTSARRRHVVYSPLPKIATKSVQPQDVIEAAPQHANYGVELQPLTFSASRKK